MYLTPLPWGGTTQVRGVLQGGRKRGLSRVGDGKEKC